MSNKARIGNAAYDVPVSEKGYKTELMAAGVK